MHNRYRLYISLCLIVSIIFLSTGCSEHAPSSTIKSAPLSGEVLSSLTLEEKIGQMLMLDFQGTQVSADLTKTIGEIKPGGLILYAGNISNPVQAVSLTGQLQASTSIPLFIATDQEGGTVSRINGGTTMPSALALGATGSPKLSYQAGFAAGEELKAMGINVDLAPVLDVWHESDSASLGSRCFSSDPTAVSEMGLAFTRGLSDAGVIACAKHFPGHGLAPVDSHLDIPVVEASRSQLNVDLKPFQQLFAGGADMVMTAHVAYPALDSTQVISMKTGQQIILPASLSTGISTDLARRELGYPGVVMTDSLFMRPIVENFGAQEEVAVMAVKAGADLLLVQKDPFSVRQRIVKAVRSGEISEARIDESVQRLLQLKQNRGLISISNGKIIPGTTVTGDPKELSQRAQQVVGSPEHRRMEQDIANKAVTLLQNRDQALPWKLREGQRIVYFVPLESIKPAADAAVSMLISSAGIKNILSQGFVFRTLSHSTSEQLKAMEGADYVVLLCYGDLIPAAAANSPQPQREFPLEIAGLTAKMGKPLLVLAGEAPRDGFFLASVQNCLLTYGSSRSGISSGLLAAFGLIKPSGHLPFPVYGSDNNILFPYGCGLGYEK